MKKNFLHIVCSAVMALLAMILSGCHGGAYAPLNTTNYNLGSTAEFVLLDKQTQDSVTCSGIEKHFLADGRLEVVVMVRNRSNRHLSLQINCNFKDESGFSVDQTPFESLFLSENGTEPARFTSINDKAKTFTVSVRQPR